MINLTTRINITLCQSKSRRIMKGCPWWYGEAKNGTSPGGPREALKYIGMDVHTETIVIAVLNARGKQVMESVIETTALAVRDFIQGLRGTVHVTFEEGTQAAWLYDIL